MPFWKKSKPTPGDSSAAATDSAGDDLAALQRQFGIKTVPTIDVQAELNQLLRATASSPDNDALDILGNAHEDEEEAQILRAIGLSSSTQLDQCEDPDALLTRLLQDDQKKPSPSRGSSTDVPTTEQVMQLKRQAVQLKREGKVKEAMGLLRQAKMLESNLPPAVMAVAPDNFHRHPESVPVPGPMNEEEQEVEVSEEDMKNPEYLAQLEMLGFRSGGNELLSRDAPNPVEASACSTGSNAPPTQETIQELKRQAVQLKREGNIKAALSLLREVKELEQRAAAAAAAAPAPPPREMSVAPRPIFVETVDVEVEVTDEDMNDPEYLAQLSALGFDPASATRVEEATPPSSSQKQEESINEQIVQLKRQVVQLKHEGRTKAALDLLREVKALERSGSASGSCADSTDRMPSVVQPPPLVETIKVVDDVEVTANDMKDPEYAAQLDQMCFASEPPVEKQVVPESNPLELLQSQLLQEKRMAIHYKRENNMTEAMQSMRQVKELEEQLTRARTACVERASDALEETAIRQKETTDQDELIDEFEDEEEGENAAREQEQKRELAAAICVSPPQPNASSIDTPETDTHSSGSEVQKERDPVDEIADLEAQLQRAKETAVLLKREGRTTDAISTMRRVKQIENLISMKKQRLDDPLSNALLAAAEQVVLSPLDMERKAKFDELEKLLIEFSNRSMTDARELLKTDRTQASVLVEQRKKYVAELETLRAKRLDPNQDPPPFAVESRTEQKEFIQPNIAEDEIHVTVTKLSGISAELNGHSIFVNFCLNVPSQNPHQGKTVVVTLASGGAAFATTPFKFTLQRSRGIQRLFELRKATFEVWRPATFLRNAEMIARTSQELTPLLSACEIQSCLPLVGPNRKPTGAKIWISISLRTPLREKEMRDYKREVVVIGSYPPPVDSTPVAVTPSTSTNSTSSMSGESRCSGSTATATQNEAVAEAVAPKSEEDDPHSVEIIISYDVINEELDRIQTKLASFSSDPTASPVAMELSDRADSLALKKQLLEIEMQTGKLTLDAYVARLNARMTQDRALIKSLLKKGKRSDAAMVLRRVNIMQKELQMNDDDSASF